jgi:sugar/nucleoside kinase (ribokinase family)
MPDLLPESMVDDIDDLEELAERAEELDGENEVPLTELFNPSFMRKYTDFESLEEFLEESPWVVESEEDLDEIPDSPFNEYVKEHTVFSDQDEMMNKAGEEWTADQLGL